MNKTIAVGSTVLAFACLTVAPEANAVGAVNACTWTTPLAAAAALPRVRAGLAATALADGTVLVTGGSSATATTNAADLYNPITDRYAALPPMNASRYFHTATRLATGKVLIVGGSAGAVSGLALASAELYDPVAKTFTAVGSMTKPRLFHTATLMSDGRVLVVGGSGPSGAVGEVELFDPGSNTFTLLAPHLALPRSNHTATRLGTTSNPSDSVLVVGGQTANGASSSVELIAYVAAMHTISVTTAPRGLAQARQDHTATLLLTGDVLVVGGADNSNRAVAPVELWVGNQFTARGQLTHPRMNHSATLLPTGQVLVAGGLDTQGVAPVELYTSGAGFKDIGSLTAPRFYFATAELRFGQVLFVGGFDSSGINLVAGSEAYDPFWAGVGPMRQGRADHSATLLADGRVLLAGGGSDSGAARSDADLFDPGNGSFSTVAMSSARAHHTASLLPGGAVLLAGGQAVIGSFVATADVFDPASNAFTPTASMASTRTNHAAVAMKDGRILISGGLGGTPTASLSSSELYTWNATTKTGGFTAGPAMLKDRFDHAMSVLDTGKVVVTGGRSNAAGGISYSVEDFDPAAMTFQLRPNSGWLYVNRQAHVDPSTPGAATTLAIGGLTSGITPTASFERVSNGGLGQMQSARFQHAVAGTRTGPAVFWVVGGRATYSGDALTSVEAIDASVMTTSSITPLDTGRARHTATLLANGRILVAGGYEQTGLSQTAVVSKSTLCITKRPPRPPRFITARATEARLDANTISLLTTINNEGKAGTAAFSLRYDLVSDNSEERLALGVANVQALGPQASSRLKSSFVVPARVMPGTYHVQACVPPTSELAGQCFEVAESARVSILRDAAPSVQFPAPRRFPSSPGK